MNDIIITPSMIVSFKALWKEITESFTSSHINLFYKIMPCKRNDDRFEKAIEAGLYASFNYFRNGGCAENIVFPIYILNNKSLTGDYKVLTNDNKEYHFVIYNKSKNEIYDPTFEKVMDSNLIDNNPCKGIECTFPMLGPNCMWMELEDYLNEYDVPESSNQTEANREFYNILINQNEI